jgi:hypothetical protein
MEQRLEWASQESSLSTRGDIIRWWEARRYDFNGFLLAVGFASWLLVMIAGSAAVKPGEDFEEPLGMFFGPVVYLAVANVGYALGWVVDTVFYKGQPRVRLYKSGLIFAVVLTGLPGVWAVVAWLITVHTGRKLD